MDLKNVIVITGASSGFGALAARALAKAGHIVYASMRETTGRNAKRVEAAKQFSIENNVDLRTIEAFALTCHWNESLRYVVVGHNRLDG